MNETIVRTRFSRGRTARVALVWAQFMPVHVDRIRAVETRLQGAAQLTAVELASSTRTYSDFAPTAPLDGIAHRLLFPGRVADDVPVWPMLRALLRELRRHDLVCIGIPYSVPAAWLAAILLRLWGTRVILVYDSKFDDKPRSVWFEAIKALGLACYDGAIVASARSRDYLRFLGFRRRPLLGGSNGVSLARLRDEAARGGSRGDRPFAARDFVFVGRFVGVKNLAVLIEAVAIYARSEPRSPRRLVLIGSGPMEAELRDQISRHGLEDRVRFAGFRSGPELAATIADALALVLPSSSEPWGFVVNEALALDVPVIVSEAPGARDVLVRNLVNGLVVPAGSAQSLAAALALLGRDEAAWQAMRAAARERAWLGDSERFADAVQLLLDPAAEPAASNMASYLATFDEAVGGAGGDRA